ncbi:MAG TPA: CHAT domain-containing protein [Gemmatimonadaceae bacterium]|nr:CHAT domain-containing protein [Gemmatimonadaceae bacterium]
MMPWRAVRSLVAVAVMPLRVAAQDTENRVARAIDLAAAHAVAVDSQAVVAAQWRASLARTPSDRFAALGLASLARVTYDSVADHELAMLAAGSDAVARRAMLGRALLVAATGRWAIADTLYAAAEANASAAHDSILEADAAFGRFAVTLARFAPARLEVVRADSMRPRSDALLDAASVCAHAALAPSDAGLRAATAQADQVGDARLAAACLNPLPGFLYSQSHEDSADAAASEVIARDRRTLDRSALAIALMFRCYRRLTLFDYGRSAVDCREAVHEGAAIGSPYAVGWAELNLGALNHLLGDEAAARLHNARSRAALSTIGDLTGLGILRRSDADLSLDAGDTAAAHAAALDALHAARPGADAGGAWSRLADIALRERRFDDARHDLDSNVAALRRGHAETFLPPITLKYAAILLRQGRPGDALSRLLVSVYDTNQHVARYLVSERRAEALVALGQSTQALVEMERANDDLERWRRTLTDRELRVLAFQTGRTTFGGPSPGLALVVASAAQHGSLARAFALAERQRARDLADQRRRAEAMRGGALPSGTVPVTHIVTLAELRRAIPDDSTAVLEYVAGPVGAATTVFVVTRRSAATRSLLPADSMADDIELFDDLIDQRRNTEAIALSLGSRVLAPALVAVPPRIVRLVIMSDGPLHRVPFAALRVAGGVTVVDRYAVSLEPSATVAADLWTHPVPATDRAERVLAFGDPIPDAPRAATGDDVDRAASPVSLDPLASDALPRLPWSADEARMAAAFGGQSVVLVGRDATPEALAAAPLDSFAIIHFATHALVDEQVPARSALVLSRGLGRSGLVDAGSLELHHVSASLIVLSACRTARGELVEGEGVRGLANPFLGAGAHAVLATQWAVGDRTVVPLVYAVYLGLAQGLPASEAVRRAEAAARRRGAPVREWAALTLMGDPLVRVRLRAPPEKQVPAWIRDANSATATPPDR